MPAIAYAVDHGAPGASAAWARLTGATNWNTVLQSGFENTPPWGVIPYQQSPPVADTVPDRFAFPFQSDVALGAIVTSASITVTGIDAETPISVAAGTYSVNGGAFTAIAGTVTIGNTVRARLTAALNNSTQTCVTVTIGGVPGQFCATTVAPTQGNWCSTSMTTARSNR
jgi:hypothetical protein